MDTRKDENELHLLGGSTVYKQDYAPEVLEAFTNKHPDNDYWVRFNCPEFTSLCPITGQPDFATIYIDYIPDVKMVESKSLKLYLFSFRNHGAFHEDCVNIKGWQNNGFSTIRRDKKGTHCFYLHKPLVCNWM